MRAGFGSTSQVLSGVRVDDWVFGVASVSEDGFRKPGCIRRAGRRVNPTPRRRRPIALALGGTNAERERMAETDKNRTSEPRTDTRIHRKFGDARGEARDRARVRAFRATQIALKKLLLRDMATRD